MTITAIFIYELSLLFWLSVIFCLKILDKPKQLNFGIFGNLRATPRDFYFLGGAAILVAVGYTFLLFRSVATGLIPHWFDGPGISYLFFRIDPGQFKFQLYVQSTVVPLILAIGFRLLVYARHLARQT